MAKIILDDWQEEALAHKGDLLLCTGRQIGKTFIMSLKAATRMMEQKTEIVVVSLTEDQAQLIIQMVLEQIENKAKTMIRKGRHAPTKNRIQLKNGSTIISRPVGITGNSVRGFH